MNVWQKAHKMALAKYKATLSFHREEVYLDLITCDIMQKLTAER